MTVNIPKKNITTGNKREADMDAKTNTDTTDSGPFLQEVDVNGLKVFYWRMLSFSSL